MRPLYLAGTEQVQVSLDGPALLVRGPARADGRYPLSRLSRVIVQGAVEWTTPALLACLRAGIPVAFMDRSGKPLGLCFGAQRVTGLGSLVRRFLELPDWRFRYRGWLDAMEWRAALDLARARGWHLKGMRPRIAWRSLVLGVQREFPGHDLQVWYRYLERLTEAYAAEALARNGFGLELLCWKYRDFNLVAGLARVLSWEVHGIVYDLFAGRKGEGAPDRRAAATVFQAGSEVRERRFASLLHAFEQWLLEQLP